MHSNWPKHIIDRLQLIPPNVMWGQLLSKLNKYSWISVDIMHVEPELRPRTTPRLRVIWFYNKKKKERCTAVWKVAESYRIKEAFRKRKKRDFLAWGKWESERIEGNEVSGFARLPYLKTLHNSSLVPNSSRLTGVLHRPAPQTDAFYRSETKWAG